jgi:hypothetical protein
MEENNVNPGDSLNVVSEPISGSNGVTSSSGGQVAPVKTLNNGRRADRVLARAKRREFLGKEPDFETLFKAGLLKINSEGKIKLVPETDAKWIALSDKAEDAPTTGEPAPPMVEEPTPAPVGEEPMPAPEGSGTPGGEK